MTSRPLSAAACAVAIASLAACASRPAEYRETYGSPGPVVTQPPADPQSAAYAEYGSVRTIDVMPLSSRTTGGGAILGAVIGAAIGNQFGAGTGRAAATIGGAVAGGVAGNAIEHRTRREDEVFRVGVRFDDGSFREFDFQRVDELQVGDRVKWEGGQLYRL
jgi:outer membrane lipoprotein SlyB